MPKRLLLLFMMGVMLVSSAAAQDSRRAQVVQWASSVAASSQFGDESWSAEQALGEPNVFECSDHINAWASLGSDTEETLTLFYDKPVTPTQVNIFQTFTPGSITGIDLIPAEGDNLIPVPNSADLGTACPGVFSINLPEDLPEVMGVVIYLDQSIGGSWNEIDAVELVGWVTGDPSKSMESSLESGDFEIYAVSSNDAVGASDNEGTPNTNDFTGEWATAFSCDNGVEITNGIDLTIIQQRPGNTYSVTVVGIDGFDPVLAVRDEVGNHLCSDDDSTAATYSANLPTTGQVNTASSSSQVIFSNNASGLADITITVGGFGGSAGEFLVIVEGMVATDGDGAGDPFSLLLSPALLASGVVPTAYNIAVTNVFDPVITLIDENYEIIDDTAGVPILCDDAGNSDLCWGESTNLASSYVSRSQERQLPGGDLDAMLAVLPPEPGGYYNFAMTGNNSFGDYVAVFHLGTAQE
jgi:hypothetical protein